MCTANLYSVLSVCTVLFFFFFLTFFLSLFLYLSIYFIFSFRSLILFLLHSSYLYHSHSLYRYVTVHSVASPSIEIPTSSCAPSRDSSSTSTVSDSTDVFSFSESASPRGFSLLSGIHYLKGREGEEEGEGEGDGRMCEEIRGRLRAIYSDDGDDDGHLHGDGNVGSLGEGKGEEEEGEGRAEKEEGKEGEEGGSDDGVVVGGAWTTPGMTRDGRTSNRTHSRRNIEKEIEENVSDDMRKADQRDRRLEGDTSVGVSPNQEAEEKEVEKEKEVEVEDSGKSNVQRWSEGEGGSTGKQIAGSRKGMERGREGGREGESISRHLTSVQRRSGDNGISRLSKRHQRRGEAEKGKEKGKEKEKEKGKGKGKGCDERDRNRIFTCGKNRNEIDRDCNNKSRIKGDRNAISMENESELIQAIKEMEKNEVGKLEFGSSGSCCDSGSKSSNNVLPGRYSRKNSFTGTHGQLHTNNANMNNMNGNGNGNGNGNVSSGGNSGGSSVCGNLNSVSLVRRNSLFTSFALQSARSAGSNKSNRSILSLLDGQAMSQNRSDVDYRKHKYEDRNRRGKRNKRVASILQIGEEKQQFLPTKNPSKSYTEIFNITGVGAENNSEGMEQTNVRGVS